MLSYLMQRVLCNRRHVTADNCSHHFKWLLTEEGGRNAIGADFTSRRDDRGISKAIADGVHQAMIDAIGIPPKDRFQVISEYKTGGLIYDAEYLDIKRSDKIVFVQITLSTGRKPGQKRALFARMAELLAKSPGPRPEDFLVNLVEVSWENWSFGKGEAQYQKD